MAYYDRQYSRDPARTGPFTRLRLWSVTTWVIIVNIAVFVVGNILARPLGYDPLWEYGYFSASKGVLGLELWRWITFQFLHAGIGHVFFNMLALFFFGPMIEQYLGARRFLAFYLIGGAAGPIGYLLLWWSGLIVSDAAVPLVGASAGVFAVLAAGATIAPHTRVHLLFPPVTLTLRTLALILIGIGAFTVLAYGHRAYSNAGGEAAHLGGALFGWLLIRRPGLLAFAEGKFLKRVSPARVRGDARRYSFNRRLERQHAEEAEVDRILEKVHRDGMHSLTKAEKRTLTEASERRRD